MINTTLNEILKHNPDKDLWEKLLRDLGKTEAEAEDDNEPLPLVKILAINGLNDALRCLSFLPQRHAKTVSLFACDIVEHVLPFFEDKFPKDERLRRAIHMARVYIAGGCTGEELQVAKDGASLAAAEAAKAAAYAAQAAISNDDATYVAWATGYAARAAAYADAANDTTFWATVWAAFYAIKAVAYAAEADAAKAEEHWQDELFIKYFG